MKKKVLSIHFVLLAIAFSNAILKSATLYQLSTSIEFGIKLLVVVSALVLFFLHLKPFLGLSYYFSIYIGAVMMATLGLIFRGILGAMAVYLVLFPLALDDLEFQEKEIRVYSIFQGFMAPCCSYVVKERQLLVFEKDLGSIKSEGGGGIDFETMTITASEANIFLTYETKFEPLALKKVSLKRH